VAAPAREIDRRGRLVGLQIRIDLTLKQLLECEPAVT
jgi:hypothetical protein